MSYFYTSGIGGVYQDSSQWIFFSFIDFPQKISIICSVFVVDFVRSGSSRLRAQRCDWVPVNESKSQNLCYYTGSYCDKVKELCTNH